MELRERIDSALKQAMKDRDENRRNALRLLLTALKVKEKELKRLPTEAEIQQTISSQIKQRKDAIELYGKGGRPDLAEKEEEEVRVLQSFLPEALSPEDLERLVDEAVAESGATSAKEMGKVMKVLMPKVAGRADGKALNERVRARLGS
jgi:uncharacterized protein YqeY